MQRNYTADDVMRYRDENSCSVFSAKAYFERKNAVEQLAIAQRTNDFDLLCDIVKQLIKKVDFRDQ
jgi:hypothetical protein